MYFMKVIKKLVIELCVTIKMYICKALFFNIVILENLDQLKMDELYVTYEFM